jgi:hypothetical protein
MPPRNDSSTQDVFAQMDQTSGPYDVAEPDDAGELDDAAGPEEEAGAPIDETGETGDPEEEAGDPEDTGAPRRRMRRLGPTPPVSQAIVKPMFDHLVRHHPRFHGLTLHDATELARYFNTRGANHAHHHHTRHDLRHIDHAHMRHLANRVIRQFWLQHGKGAIIETKGFYYATARIDLLAEGTGNDCVLYPAATQFPAFDESIGDQVIRLNGTLNYTVTARDTNLQNPARNLYPDQVFIITHVNKRFRGIRIAYNAADIKAANPPPHAGIMLTGATYTWDDAGIYLPAQFFNTFDNSCLIAQVVRAAATLYFTWTDLEGGGNSDTRIRLISPFIEVPDNGHISKIGGLTSTSGGLGKLALHEGYVWALNRQYQGFGDSGGGQFNAIVGMDDSFAFPFRAVNIGGGTPVTPAVVGLEWDIWVHGISLRVRGKGRLRQEARLNHWQ